MRTSLNNIKAIDDFLLGNMPPGDKLLFEANVILNKHLVNDIKDQQKTYNIIKQYGRRQIKNEIIALQRRLTTEPKYQGFMQRITNLFKKH